MNEEDVKQYFEDKIRPLTRVDGGDMRFMSYENETLTVMACAACSTCPNCLSDLENWIKNRMNKELSIAIKNIEIRRNIPYYK